MYRSHFLLYFGIAAIAYAGVFILTILVHILLYPRVHASPRAKANLSVAKGAVLERRLDMALDVRRSLAARLAASTAARMNIPGPAAMPPETFLEEVAYGVRSLGKLR